MKRLNNKPFVLLGVNSDKDREEVKKIVAKEQLTWRSWWDEGNIEGPIHIQWQILERPSIHILDAKGVVRFKNIPSEKVNEAIDALLSELTDERE